MISLIKKYIPEALKDKLRPIKLKLVDNPRKRRLAVHMREKHRKLLQQIKGKEKIKVVFLAIHKSVWKVDPVFKKMLDDPFFEPLILVCPYVIYGEERMWEDMKEAHDYFEGKGYPVLSSYNDQANRWMTLGEIKPDIVFFTNPHNITRKEYYEDAYLNYLSCYMPYFFLTTTHDNDISIYNQEFHNLLWIYFMPHTYSYFKLIQVSSVKGKNGMLVGYPFIENFLNLTTQKLSNAWKIQKYKKIKIIFAPHHTIENDGLMLSNFLSIAEYIKDLAERKKDKVQWSFKPHPILKSKLFNHPEWGKEKTREYYNFWNNNTYTQYDHGDYVDLFLESDAIVHDCGSFIAEYLFVQKPCAYLCLNGPGQIKYINRFGKQALECYKIIETKYQIEEFVDSLTTQTYCLKNKHYIFIDKYKNDFFIKKTPSETINKTLYNKIKY